MSKSTPVSKEALIEHLKCIVMSVGGIIEMTIVYSPESQLEEFLIIKVKDQAESEAIHWNEIKVWGIDSVEFGCLYICEEFKEFALRILDARPEV